MRKDAWGKQTQNGSKGTREGERERERDREGRERLSCGIQFTLGYCIYRGLIMDPVFINAKRETHWKKQYPTMRFPFQRPTVLCGGDKRRYIKPIRRGRHLHNLCSGISLVHRSSIEWHSLILSILTRTRLALPLNIINLYMRVQHTSSAFCRRIVVTGCHVDVTE